MANDVSGNISRVMENAKKVLVVLVGTKSISDVKAILERENSQFHYVFNDRIAMENGKTKCRSLLEQYDDCCQILTMEKFAAVISGCDDKSSLVVAALSETFPWIKTASFESVFLCWNKHYCRKMLEGNDLNIPFTTVNAFDKLEVSIEKVSKMCWPLVFKPACGTTSRGIEFLEKKEDLVNSLSFVLWWHEQDREETSKFLSKFIEFDKYPLAMEPLAVVEKKIEYMNDSNVSCFSVEVLLANGEMIPWCICDVFFWPHKPNCPLGWGCPTQLDSSLQAKVWEAMKSAADLLQKYGYRNQFLDAEFFVWKNGDVKLIEFNGRIPGNVVAISLTHENGNMFDTLVQASQGCIPKIPRPKKDNYSIYAPFETFASGKSTDLVNFKEANEYGNKLPLVKLYVSDESVLPPSKSLQRLAAATVEGKSAADCMTQLHQLKHKVLKKHSKTMWFDTEATELPLKLDDINNY